MTTAIEAIHIGEDEIQGIRGEDGSAWVVVRRVCEVLGLDPSGQRQKLQAQPWARAEIISSHDASGREQELYCLHADSVPMWLATIDASRCGESQKIVRFQREAAKVLADWAYGRRPSPSDLDLRDPAQLQRLALSLTGIVQEQQKQLTAAAPEVEFYDAFADATGTYCFTAAAKIIEEQPRLWMRWLDEQGHTYRRGGQVYARQDHLDAGRMVQRIVVVNEQQHVQTKLTPKGIAYFAERRPGLRGVRRLPRQHALRAPEPTP